MSLCSLRPGVPRSPSQEVLLLPQLLSTPSLNQLPQVKSAFMCTQMAFTMQRVPEIWSASCSAGRERFIKEQNNVFCLLCSAAPHLYFRATQGLCRWVGPTPNAQGGLVRYISLYHYQQFVVAHKQALCSPMEYLHLHEVVVCSVGWMVIPI